MNVVKNAFDIANLIFSYELEFCGYKYTIEEALVYFVLCALLILILSRIFS